jgi:hypothetical protein
MKRDESQGTKGPQATWMALTLFPPTTSMFQEREREREREILFLYVAPEGCHSFRMVIIVPNPKNFV